PPWWPRPIGSDGSGGVLRPRLLEVVAEPGSGRLTLALAWLAAARPALAAIVDAGASEPWRPTSAGDLKLHPERFYPPAAAGAGLDLPRLVVVQPPVDDPRAPLDAVVV